MSDHRASSPASAVSVVMPVHADADALPTTLPAVLRAAGRLPGPSEIIVVVTPSGDRSRELLDRLAPAGAAWRVIELAERGKFRALRAGVDAATAPLLVLVDADVLPEADAFARLVEPLRRDEADVCLPQRLVAVHDRVGPISRLLGRWATLWSEAWQEVRRDAGFLWVLSGDLYAIRRDLFPREATIPVLDDVSVGQAARARGARFAYVRDARVYYRPPATIRDWLRQKIRTRRGFARFGQLDPAVGQVQAALLRAVRARPGGRSLTARTLVCQEQALRLVARLLEARRSRPGEGWVPVPSTKRWAGPRADPPG